MKRNYLYYLLTILFLAVSCEKDEMACTTAVETQEVSSIAATTAQCGGIISSDGNPTIKEAGVEWCTTSDFESNVSCASTAKAKLGKFACEITNLKDNTQYYVRAYARNSYGTIYGEVLSFKTLEIIPPTVLTDFSAIIVYSTSATVGGEVTNDGNGVVTERGVVYSTTSNPTTSNSKVVSGSGVRSFTCNLSNLQEVTTYYVRAYAVNEKGTAYGEEKSFTTKAITVPTVTTSSATNVLFTSATIGGTVTDDGGTTVTERGVVYSTTPNPTTSNSKVVSGSGKGAFSCNLNDLQEGTTYYVRAYAVNQTGMAYGNQIGFTTLNHEYVDLGLSVKWATCNVGATKPEEYGDYFAWGETQPKSTYNWSTYKWCRGSYDWQTKYCTNSSYGTVDNKTTLEAADDAARANWGGSWRMPTYAELTELRNNCTWTWTTQNGVYGYKVTSKKSGYTNKSIFLPAAGYRGGSSLYYAGSLGRYWSSSLSTGSPSLAYVLYFYSSYVDWSYDNRFYGQSVRPVCP